MQKTQCTDTAQGPLQSQIRSSVRRPLIQSGPNKKPPKQALRPGSTRNERKREEEREQGGKRTLSGGSRSKKRGIREKSKHREKSVLIINRKIIHKNTQINKIKLKPAKPQTRFTPCCSGPQRNRSITRQVQEKGSPGRALRRTRCFLRLVSHDPLPSSKTLAGVTVPPSRTASELIRRTCNRRLSMTTYVFNLGCFYDLHVNDRAS